MKRYGQIICSLVFLYTFVAASFGELLRLRVDLEQPVSLVDEKFLSLTIDPATLLHKGCALSRDLERSVNLAKALSPAYLRLGGPRRFFYEFNDEPSRYSRENGDTVLSESDWILAQQWAEKAGLDVISCIPPEYVAKDSKSSEDAMEIISFRDHMGYNTNWQLGYECQTNCNMSATDLAKRVVNLRRILNDFPRYSNSLITGPDIVYSGTKSQQRYLQEYFKVAAPALSAVTWHSDFGSVVLGNEGVLIRHDNLDKEKEKLFNVIGHLTKNRPLWIAESKPEECKDVFLGALVLARRLGNAAKSKIEVVMRQPSDLTKPTPAYWMSVLHKNLIGREVFEARLQSDARNHVYLYCHCTKASNKYTRGSITIFGVNLSTKNVDIALEDANVTTAHEYVLSPGFDVPNRMFSQGALLNNESLFLVNDTVPDLKPFILREPKGLLLRLQSGGVGFWVLPDFKIKSCMENYEESQIYPTSRRRMNNRVPRDIREQLEGIKRSVKDREAARTERRNQRNNSRVADTKKELKRLKKYIKRTLDDYEDKESSILKSSSAPEKKVKRNKDTNDQPDPQEDTQARLQDFKNRLSRIRNSTRSSNVRTAFQDSMRKTVQDATTLLSKVQTALNASRHEKTDEDRARASISVMDHLKSLFDRLSRVNLDSSNDSEVRETRSRAKRGVFEGFTGAQLTRRADNLSGRTVKERRKIKGREEVRTEVQPSAFKLGSSEENTFYGFFGTQPIAGFPEGDVFFPTDDSRHPQDHQQETFSHETSDRLPNVKDENIWSETGRDYHEQQTKETLKKPVRGNDRPFAELSEAETYDHLKNARASNEGHDDTMKIQSNNQDDYKNNLRRMTGYYDSSFLNDRQSDYPRDNFRTGMSITWPLEAGQTPSMNSENRRSKNTDVPITDSLDEFTRSKRKSMDLNSIFNQEMINEDDANSKDCKCRVIRRSKAHGCRSKRDTSESVDSSIDMEAVPMEELPVDSTETDLETRMELQTAAPIAATEEAELLGKSSWNAGEIREMGTNEASSEYQSNPRQSLETVDTLSAGLNEEDSPTKSSIRRNPSTFFHGEETTAPIDTIDDATEHTALVGPSPTSSTSETEEEVQDEASPSQAEGVEVKRAEAPGLSPEEIEEHDHDSNRTASGSSKRRAVARTVEGGEENSENSGQTRKKLKSSAKSRVGSPRSFEERLMKNAMTWLTMRRDIQRKKERMAEDSRRRREEQVKKLQEKLREKREEMLERYEKDVLDIVEEIKEEEEGNLRRRETWKANKSNDDYREAIDSDQLARILMYAPIKRAVESDPNASGQSEESPEVPVTEILRPRNVRERIFNPRSRQSDSTILEHPNPYELERKVLTLRDLYENEAKRRERYKADSEEDTSYFALVEDLQHPRIFRKVSNDKRSVETPRPYRHAIAVVEASSEEDSDRDNLDELFGGREVYIIDPSRYKGGEPALQLYKGCQKPEGTDPESSSRDTYEMILEPIPYAPYKIDQYKLEGEEPAQASAESNEREPGKFPDPPRNLNSEELLRILINALDARSAEQVLRRLTGEQPDRRGSARAIATRKGDKRSLGSASEIRGGDGLNEPSENANNSEEKSLEASDSLGILEAVAELEKRNETNRVALASMRDKDVETNSTETHVGKIRNRREPSPIHVGKEAGMASGRDNYLRLGENSEGSSGGEPTGASGIATESNYYEVPVKGSETLSADDLKKPLRLAGGEGSGDSKASDGEVEILNSSKSDENSSLKLDRNIDRKIEGNSGNSSHSKMFLNYENRSDFIAERSMNGDSKASKDSMKILNPLKSSKDSFREINRDSKNNLHAKMSLNYDNKSGFIVGKSLNGDSKGSKDSMKILNPLQSSKDSFREINRDSKNNLHAKMSLNYENKSDSIEEGSEERFEDSASNYDSFEGSEESVENVNLKGLPLTKRRGVLMVLPWTKAGGRFRREAINQERVDENESIERVQPIELRSREKFSSTESKDFDDIERSISRKTPLQKYTKKVDSIKEGRNVGGSNNEDGGLPSFIEASIPRLENVLVDGLGRAKNLTESVEQLIGDTNEKFNETSATSDEVDPESIGDARNVFHNAINGVQKFFVLLGGITRIFRGTYN